ncbi:MAG: His/Gly/Thr/Pro-type tRNA ligase C-terminal domain-containing protein [Candidatus Pacebacteria bacterium]|nr:His/Gly/Thr/Pro-type tRNA ligase C-terminal domain-containing protein [Candidatus Paceibacterota bacterium]
MLRENKISVYQSICKDSLKDQLSMAEEMKIPFALIFGQREAMSDSIIIKDIEKQINKTVPLSKLISELEKIIKKLK